MRIIDELPTQNNNQHSIGAGPIVPRPDFEYDRSEFYSSNGGQLEYQHWVKKHELGSDATHSGELLIVEPVVVSSDGLRTFITRWQADYYE